MEYKELFEKLGLENGEENLEKLRLYTYIRYRFDEALSSEKIDELYNYYIWLDTHIHFFDYDIEDFVNRLEDLTIDLKVKIADLDTCKLIEQGEREDE